MEEPKNGGGTEDKEGYGRNKLTLRKIEDKTSCKRTSKNLFQALTGNVTKTILQNAWLA